MASSQAGAYWTSETGALSLIAQQIAAGCTVVTPNRRLAAHLKREYDARQAASGAEVWPTADILPLSAFIERAYGDALYSSAAAGLPLLLAPAQELALWESIVRESDTGKPLLAMPTGFGSPY